MNIVSSRSKLLPCTESLSHESPCFVLLCLTLFRKQYQWTVTSAGYSVRMTISSLSNRAKFFLGLCLAGHGIRCEIWGSYSDVRLYSVLCTQSKLLNKTLEWKPFWCQGEKPEATPSVQTAMPRRKMTTRPERNITESSVSFLMPMERQSGCWCLISQFHIISQRELCHWALPDALRHDTPWLCRGRRRSWASCTRTEPVLPALTHH